MRITYRLANLADLDEIWILIKHAVSRMIQLNIFQWDELYPCREDLQTDIEKRQLSVGVIEDRIAVIYVINREYEAEYANGNWQHPHEPFVVIHRLCVSPDFQNRGIGKETLLQIERSLMSAGIHAIRLDVFTQNPFAIKLYEGLGYVRTGHANWRKGRFWLMEKYI